MFCPFLRIWIQNNNSDPTLRYTVEKIVMKKVEKSLKHWYSTGTGKTLFVLRFLNGSLRVSFLNLRFLNVMKKKVLYLMFAGFCA